MDRGAQAELLANVERGVLRLMRLIDNLLESVRIESGQLSIRRQPVDLGDVVREAARRCSARCWRSGAHAPARSTAGGCAMDSAVVGDAQRLVQVLVNLLSNAIKFAPEGSAIRIGAARGVAQQIEIWVEDDGPGVPGGDRRRDLRALPARRAAPSRTRRAWGSDCGSCKSIVERHGGSIARRAHRRQRTRFTRQPARRGRHGHPGATMKILVVDDDADMLAVTGFALQQAGYLVVQANTYGTALGTFRAEQPDLAILDINLPGGSGFDLCAAIRRESRRCRS